MTDCVEGEICPPEVVYFDLYVNDGAVPVSVAIFDDAVMAFGDVSPKSVPTTGNQVLQIQFVNWDTTLAEGQFFGSKCEGNARVCVRVPLFCTIALG